MFKATSSLLPVSFAAIWGEVTLDDVAAMERYYSSIYDTGRRFCSVVDARRADVPGSPVRREMAEMSNRMSPRSSKLSIGTSTVLDSKLLVGALTAVRWFIKSDVTLVYHASAVESLAWTTSRLALESLSTPEGAHELALRLDGAADGDALAALF